MNAKLILFPIFLIGSCVAQVDLDLLDDVFNESIFGTEHPVTTVGSKFVVINGNSYQPCGTNKVCVRQYHCNNGKVNQDGAFFIEPRMGSGCNKVFEKCCDIGETLDEPILNSRPLTVGCGYRNKNGVGIKISEPTENEAEFGEFPWMVAILNEINTDGKVYGLFKCGGSLIAPNVVLTAAHCVHVKQPQKFLVRAGEWEPKSDSEPYPPQERQVAEIIVHEKYNNSTLHNDIALLFLETSFDEAPHINTVCLPPAYTNFDMSRCIASGWGKDQFQNGKYQNILKKIDLQVVRNIKCQNDIRKTYAGKKFKLHSSFMCAGGEIGKDTCKGDGGSPLVCPMANNPDRYYQAGIVSWGVECGAENVPGVYASVPKLRSWIDKQLAYKEINANYFTP